MTFSRLRNSALLILALTSVGTSAAADPFGDPTAQEAREFGALFTEEGESSAFEGLCILGGDGWLGGLTGDLFLRLDSEREGSNTQEHALAWDSLEDRRLEKRQEPTEGRLLATSLAAKLSFRPIASFRIIGGSAIESRDDLARVEEARKIFVQPSWQPAGDDLRLTMRLDYGTNERLGKLRGEGFHGKSTLRWKACRDRCGTSIAVDLSWQELNDAVTQVHASEAMAQVRVKFLLPGFASGG